MRPAVRVLGAILLAVGIGLWSSPDLTLVLARLILITDGTVALAIGVFTKSPDRLAEEALAEFQTKGPITEPLRQSTVPEWARSVWWYSPSVAVGAAGMAFLAIPSWGLVGLGPVLLLEGILWSALVYTVARTD